MLSKTAVSSLALALFASSAAAMMPLEVYGNRFIQPSSTTKGEGTVFFIKGVDYQPGGSSDYTDDSDSDVLSDKEACLRDAYTLQQLGANTIRIYTVNPSVNHDECMSIFDAAGIYVLIDVNSPLSNQSLDRSNPESSYNYWYIERVFKVIDAFKGYSNLMGFISGNEVINDQQSAEDDPRYLRAIQRDMHQYIAKNSNRTIPVGYSAADVTSMRAATWEYFQCNIDGDENDESKADFFGLNSYEWCSGSSDWTSSGYSKVNSTFADATIPVFFTEYGCNKNSPRTFDEVSEGVFDGLVDVLSGGLIYEYSEESSEYGLVDIKSDGTLEFQDDFENLKSQYANSSIPTLDKSDVVNNTLIKCKSSKITDLYSDFGANFTLPDQPGGVAGLIKYGVNNSIIGKMVKVSDFESNYSIEDTNSDKVSNKSISTASLYTISSLADDATSSSSSATSTSASSSSSSSSKDAAVAAAEIGLGPILAAAGMGALALL